MALNNINLSDFESGLFFRKLGDDIDGEAAGDESGYSVSLSDDGTIVAIGATGNDDNGSKPNSGHVRVYKFVAATETTVERWDQLGDDIDGEASDDNSGHRVSLSGNGTIVAIGGYGNGGVNGANYGHVRVFKFVAAVGNTAAKWDKLGRDIGGDASGDQSGHSVSLSNDGTIVAIGAPYNEGVNGAYSGHVRVYKFVAAVGNTAATWDQLGDDIDGEASYDNSGYSVSLSGDGTIVAIGAILNDGVNMGGSGHVRVYKYDAIKTTAQPDQTLTNFGPIGWNRIGDDIDGEAAGDNSGWSVSLSGDGTIVAIGARYNNEKGSISGHVRVFKFFAAPETTVERWYQLGGDIDGEDAYDFSGHSVSLSADGTTVAIGAYGNDGNNGRDSGHVRVYKFVGGAWRKLGGDIDGEDAYDQSGWSVSLSADGTTMAIGARYNDGFGGLKSNSGHVRVYRLYIDIKNYISLSDEAAVLVDINTDLQSDFLKLSNDISDLKSSNSSLKSELTKTIYSMKK